MPASELGYETASWFRRMGALAVDWVASTLVVIGFMGFEDYLDSQLGSIAVLGVFVLESAAFTATMGGSFGQLATRLRVVSADGAAMLNPGKVLIRQVLIALVVPPLVFRPDGRGLHDLAAGTATVTLQTWRALTGRA